MLKRFGTFTGGLDLPEEKLATRESPVTPIVRPPGLSVPLDPCRLGDVHAAVVAGQRVRAGDVLGRFGGTPVFAPLDGRVASIGRCVLAGGPEGQFECPAVELVDLSPPAVSAPEAQAYNWRAASPEALLGRLADGGLTTLAEWPEELSRWCRQARAGKVDTLVANGMENQPFLTCGHRAMVEAGAAVIGGLAILAGALGVRRAVLAVDHRLTDQYRSMVSPARRHQVQLVGVVHKYPVGNPVMLTKVLTRREVPPGGGPFDVGAAVILVEACLAVYQWVACGVPPTHRVVTVAGGALQRPGNYLVPFGTPAAHVLAECDVLLGAARLCHGGPMTGTHLPLESVVGPGTRALLALPDEEQAAATACIRCAWCTDHCPVRLNVSSLNDLYELGQVERASEHGVLACVSCGSCSYVCPARLPLAERMRQLKRAVRRLGAQPGGPAAETMAAQNV